MEPFTFAWAAEAMGAQALGSADALITGICTDSRKGAEGALFFALPGENADGHRFVPQAFAAGAVGAVVSQPMEGAAGPQIVVRDTLRALGDLAQVYRRQFDIPVIGVTGSVGKTSTKEMLSAVLHTRFITLANEKNYNNEIGVPLTLFRLTKAHQAAVIEMGMRASGEIDRLAEIAQPSIGLITNIGFAHIERLGSRESIALAKAELLARLPEGGVAILPADDAFLETLRAQVPPGVSIVLYGQDRDSAPQPYVRIRPVAAHAGPGAEALVFVGNREAFLTLRAPGAHHLQNAGGALAVAALLNIPLKQAVEALATWEGAAGRMTVRHAPDGLTVLDDCYNAGPESMEAALATLHQRTAAQGVAVLGDMRELGSFAPEAHRFVGRKALDATPRLLVTVGELAREIASEASRVAAEQGRAMPPHVAFSDTESAAQSLRALLVPKDTVLVKGSRAMEMEKIVAALLGEEAADAHG